MNRFNRKEILNLSSLMILLVAIPVAVTLLKDSQIFRSQAAVEAVKFVGANITTFNSRLSATSQNVEIEVQDPFAEGGSAAPSAVPAPGISPVVTPAPGGTPKVDIIEPFPSTSPDGENVTIHFSTSGATSVNLWLNIDKNNACERWNNDSTCSHTNGPIIMQMNNLSDGSHTITWPNNYPGHHPGTHEIGLHSYYCPRTGYPDLVTDGAQSIDCTGGTAGELDKREITITGSGDGGAPTATVTSVSGTSVGSASTVTFTTTGANTVNLWVDCGERWSSTDGSCGNDKDYAVQMNNLTNGTHTLTWPSTHPRHTAGTHTVSVHPYSCTNSFGQSLVSGPNAQTNPCSGTGSRGGAVAPVQTVTLTGGGGSAGSYLMRILQNGTQVSEFRCPVSTILIGSGMNSCQLSRSYSVPTLKYTSEWIANFGSTPYMMRIAALTDGNVKEYRCPLSTSQKLGFGTDPATGCSEIRSYSVPTLKYTSEWIANFGSTAYLMRVVGTTDGNIKEYRCALNSSMNLGVNMDINTCTNIRSYDVPTLKFTDEWVNGNNLMRLVATTDGEVVQYSCALNSVMNLGVNMDPATCTRLGSYSDVNLKYSSVWIGQSAAAITALNQQEDQNKQAMGGLMSYLPNLVKEAQAQQCPSGDQYFSCSDITCPSGQIAPGGGCYPSRYSSDCLANCPSAPAPTSPPAYSSFSPSSYSAFSPSSGGTTGGGDCPAPKQYFSCNVDCGAGKVAVNGRFCYDPNGVGGPCTPTSLSCSAVNDVAFTEESCTSPAVSYPNCGSAECDVVRLNSGRVEISRTHQASCTACASSFAACTAQRTTASPTPASGGTTGGGGGTTGGGGTGGVTTPGQFPVGTRTIRYKFSDDPSVANNTEAAAWGITQYTYDFSASGGNRKPFTFTPNVCITQPCDTYPRELRRVYVLFIGRKPDNTEVKMVVQAPNIVLAIAPRIDNVACGVANTGSGMSVSVKGVHFGNGNGTTADIGSVRVKDRTTNQEQNLVVPTGSWTNIAVSGTVPNPFGDNTDITLTTFDGQSSLAVACSPDKSQIDFKSSLTCRTVDKPLSTADVEIKEASGGAVVFPLQKVNFTADGRPQSLFPKLTEGKVYDFTIQTLSTLKKTKTFTATKGTTSFQILNLPLGDIFPAAAGDCTINSLDKNEMSRQWSVGKDVTNRKADFNQDSRVNSLDNSCLISNFNKSCDRP